MVPALVAFPLTVAMEWAVLAWFSKLGFARTGLFCLCMNGATWGVLNGTLTLWPKFPIWIGEAAVMMAEALLLRWFWSWRPLRALVGSLLMNLTSWLIGGPIVLIIARSL